jgi:hypothetical protein
MQEPTLSQREYEDFLQNWSFQYNSTPSSDLTPEILARRLYEHPHMMVSHHAMPCNDRQSTCLLCGKSWETRSIYTAEDIANAHFQKVHPQWPLPHQERADDLAQAKAERDAQKRMKYVILETTRREIVFDTDVPHDEITMDDLRHHVLGSSPKPETTLEVVSVAEIPKQGYVTTLDRTMLELRREGRRKASKIPA